MTAVVTSWSRNRRVEVHNAVRGVLADQHGLASENAAIRRADAVEVVRLQDHEHRLDDAGGAAPYLPRPAVGGRSPLRLANLGHVEVTLVLKLNAMNSAVGDTAAALLFNEPLGRCPHVFGRLVVSCVGNEEPHNEPPKMSPATFSAAPDAIGRVT